MRSRDWSSDVCSSDLRRSQPHTVPVELYNLGVACGAGPEQELATVGEAREAADAPETARIRSALAASSDRQKSPGSLADGYARAIIRNADRACIMVDADIYPADRKSTRLNSSH